MDLEVFILNTMYPYVDGFCTYYHGLSVIDKEIAPEVRIKDAKIRFFKSYDVNYGGHGCNLKFSGQVFDEWGNKIRRKPVILPKSKDLNKKSSKSCGACAMYDFNKIKIKSLKIVERGASTESKMKDTNFIRKGLNILNSEKNLSRKKFIGMIQELYRNTYQCDECSGFSCYYPSVFMDGR
jgi:hypothetical protein